MISAKLMCLVEYRGLFDNLATRKYDGYVSTGRRSHRERQRRRRTPLIGALGEHGEEDAGQKKGPSRCGWLRKDWALGGFGCRQRRSESTTVEGSAIVWIVAEDGIGIWGRGAGGSRRRREKHGDAAAGGVSPELGRTEFRDLWGRMANTS